MQNDITIRRARPRTTPHRHRRVTVTGLDARIMETAT
jgi:hypothetical protein